MKNICLIIFSFFNLGYAFSQTNNEDHYQLYKGGNLIKKEVVFISSEKQNSIENSNEIVFNIDKQSFLYNKQKHTSKELTIADYNQIEFESIKDLFILEEKIFLKQVSIVEKEKGFKPIAPINTSLLKVYIISKNAESITQYEVDWLKGAF